MDDAARGRRALIAGASGLVGSRVLARLLADARWSEVHALVRRPLPAALRALPGAADGRLVEHEVDFASIARRSGLPRVDDVALCLGTTIRAAGSQQAFRRVDFDAVVGTARVALRGGAQRLAAVSALGADASSRVFYNRVKGETEAELSRLDYASITLLRPSLLDGERAESRPAERLALGLARPLAALIPARWRPIAADAVAAALVEALRRGEPGLRIVESDRIARDAA